MGSLLSSVANSGNDCSSGSSAVITITNKSSWDEHWAAGIENNKLMLIDFYAEWCGPCRFMGPTFKAFAAKNPDIVFIKVDVDDVPELAQQWKVQAMPMFLMARGGKEIDRVVGAKKTEVEMMILRHLKI